MTCDFIVNIVKWKLIVTSRRLVSCLCNFARREITYTRLISYRSWFFHNGICQPSRVTRANICRIHSKNMFQWHAPYETQTATKFIRWRNHSCTLLHSIAIYLLRSCTTVGCRCGLYAVDGHAMIKLGVNIEIHVDRSKSDCISKIVYY